MKKMNKKGFTLIELLAIIVILAIIAVITVPLILGIIDEAKAKSAKSSIVGYGKAVELAYSHHQLGTASLTKPDTGTGAITPAELSSGSYVKLQVGSTTSDTINLKVDFSGDKVVCSTTAGDNSISTGKLVLKNCKPNGTGSITYVYDNGRACLTTEYTNNSNACPAS